MDGGEQQGSHWRQISLLELVAALPSPPDQPATPVPDRAPETALVPAAAEAAPAADSDEGSGNSPEGTTTAASQAATAAATEPRQRPAAADNPESGPALQAIAPAHRPTSPRRRRRSAVAGDAPSEQPDCTSSDSHTSSSNSPDKQTATRDGRKPAPAAEAGVAEVATTPRPSGDLPACPRQLLILDTETTGLSPAEGQCIEVGAVLFDVASRSVLMQVSFLLPCAANPAQHVNGIPAAVSRLSQPWRSGLACFEAMVAGADAVLAHNAGFDRQWFGTGELPALEKPWICSMEDIRWPAERQLRATPSVRDLALAYGVPVWEAHRALTDCIYLVQVFQRCHDLEALLQAALEPRRLVRARLSYDQRQLAKDAGFRWNEPVPRAWSRRLSEREIAALPFPVDAVEADEPGRERSEAPRGDWRRSA